MVEGLGELDEAPLLAERGEGEAGEDGEEEDLEDLARGEGAGVVLGDDVEEEVGDAEVGALSGVLGDGFGVEGAGINVHAAAGADEVGDGHADEQGEGGDGLEVEERLEADAAEAAGIADAGDADDDGEEDDGGDEHADELDEAVAEGLELLAEMGEESADEDAGEDAKEDAEVEGAEEGVGTGLGGGLDGELRRCGVSAMVGEAGGWRECVFGGDQAGRRHAGSDLTRQMMLRGRRCGQAMALI